MDKILDRQNQPQMLKILCASRILYNKAEMLNHLVWGLTIAAPIISVIFNAIRKDTTPAYFVISIVVFLPALILELHLQGLARKASSLRIFFCNHVLGLCIEEDNPLETQQIYEIAEKTVSKNQENATIQMQNSGNGSPPGVKDWYVIPHNCEEESAVFECQKCDAWWDTKIRKTCSIVIVTIMISIVTVVLIGSVLLQCSFLFLLYSSLGLIEKTGLQTVLWIKYYNLSKEIDGIIKSMSIDRTKRQEQYLQQKLNERRSLPVLHINQVYKKIANKLSNLYASTNSQRL